MNSFDEVFSSQEVLKVLESYLLITGSSVKLNDLKTTAYFLFFKFLVEEKKISYNVFLIILTILREI